MQIDVISFIIQQGNQCIQLLGLVMGKYQICVFLYHFSNFGKGKQYFQELLRK